MSESRVAWLSAADPPEAFPDAGNALIEPDGLLAAGGDLSVARIVYAYTRGIFPWFSDGEPILWWSPDPRCVLRPQDYHVSRSTQRDMRSSTLSVTCNRSFGQVITACAEPRRSEQGTWITPAIIAAFEALHADGWAHSVEVRDGNNLAGGLYGLAIGDMFFAESMFSRQRNASKFALAALCRMMSAHGIQLIDCQVVSEHLLTIGATTLPRAAYLRHLQAACASGRRFDRWPDTPLAVAGLSQDTPSGSLQ